MFLWALQCLACQFEKVQTSWLVSRCLVLLFGPPASLYRSTVYVHTNMHAVSVCFRNPPNYDMGYWIFNVPHFFILEGPWAPFDEILEATLQLLTYNGKGEPRATHRERIDV